MSLVSAVPGKLLSTTLQLPKSARGAVTWSIRDHKNRLVGRGQVSVSGTNVVISTVLPSTCHVPNDGSKYLINATDGYSSVSEYFSVVSGESVNVQHNSHIAYLQNRVFRDTLIVDEPVQSITIAGTLINGASLILANTPVTAAGRRLGDGWAYNFDYSTDSVGKTATPPGSLNTYTSACLGYGTVIWDFQRQNAEEPDQEIHHLFTITPYSSNFMRDIKMLVDKARIGDVNQYLSYTTTDLCHALLRGCDYVMQSPPVAGGWPLDLMPLSLKDYIVKAGALDLLRAQYQAEGMSQFDMQGLGVQLTVDRTQFLSELINELTSDLQGLVQAKNEWLNQGAPLGPVLPAGRRTIGVLGISRGTYSPWPMVPLPVVMGGYTFLGAGAGFGPMY